MRSVFNDADVILFFVFFIEAYVVGTHLNCLEAIQMSTHNICFYKEVDKSTLVVMF